MSHSFWIHRAIWIFYHYFFFITIVIIFEILIVFKIIWRIYLNKVIRQWRALLLLTRHLLENTLSLNRIIDVRTKSIKGIILSRNIRICCFEAFLVLMLSRGAIDLSMICLVYFDFSIYVDIRSHFFSGDSDAFRQHWIHIVYHFDSLRLLALFVLWNDGFVYF